MDEPIIGLVPEVDKTLDRCFVDGRGDAIVLVESERMRRRWIVGFGNDSGGMVGFGPCWTYGCAMASWRGWFP